MEKFLLGCDWGTSSFRLRLFDVTARHVVGEVLADEGIATMHSLWQDGAGDGITKHELFRQYLKKQINALAADVALNLDNISIFISGMASSSIGMEDVPYATVPFALDGSDTIIKSFEPRANFPHEIVLISGVRSDDDVMRGEETQLIGLLDLLKQEGSQPANGILIFPGTHSKHIRIEGESLTGFRTFMTGELFNVIRNHTILKDSVDAVNVNELSGIDAEAFKWGVKEVNRSGILNSLFTVRTNQLFQKLNKAENFFYLSGLLVGAELSYLSKAINEPLFLCCGSNLYSFYTGAIEALGLSPHTSIVPVDLVDKAALYGQKLIFEHQIVNETK